MVSDGAPVAGPCAEGHMARQGVRRRTNLEVAQGVKPRRRARQLHRRRKEKPLEVGRTRAAGTSEEARHVYGNEDSDCKWIEGHTIAIYTFSCKTSSLKRA